MIRHAFALLATISVASCDVPEATTPSSESETTPGAAETANTAARSVTEADYDRAFSLLVSKLPSLVKRPNVIPRWIEGGQAFWYRRQSDAGYTYVRIETASGERSPLFDHVALAEAAGTALEREIDPQDLPFIITSYNEAAGSFSALVEKQKLACTLSESECSLSDVEKSDPGLMLSDDGGRAIFTRDYNLWLRDMETGEEQALTDDGEAYYAYGKTPDASLAAVPEKRHDLIKPPYASFWSPDGRFVVAVRADERRVGTYPFVEWAPLDGSFRPIVYNLKVPLYGDAEKAEAETHVIDTLTGEKRKLSPGAGMTIPPGGLVAWSTTGDKLFMLAQTVGAGRLQLLEIDAATGGIRVVIEETSDSQVKLNPALYNEPNIRLLKDGAEVLWFSERSGWGHLYRMDATTGEIITQLTDGEWSVFDIVRVDEDAERVFFTAGGRESGRDPYYRHLYRVNFDGTDLTLLTPENANHRFMGIPSFLFRSVFSTPLPPPLISPDGSVFVDTYSTLAEPTVTLLRRTENAAVVTELERMDVSALLAVGFRSPERVSGLASDGKTTIYGSVYLPTDFDPESSYPIINALYAGPQVSYAPSDYIDAVSSNRAALASLGFVVVTIDGRGTPYRSKAFQDVSRGDGHGDETLKDHRVLIEALASERPYMDISRVGVYGHSWGGYHSARAILLDNDFYDVAVSSAGVHAYHLSYLGFESFLGVAQYDDGSSVRPSPNAVPVGYASMDNLHLADRLQGKLLLMYGDLDENVAPSQAVQFIDALIKANKDFDLLYLPNRTHYFFGREVYETRRRFDYFVEHLHGVQPPSNYTPPKDE